MTDVDRRKFIAGAVAAGAALVLPAAVGMASVDEFTPFKAGDLIELAVDGDFDTAVYRVVSSGVPGPLVGPVPLNNVLGSVEGIVGLPGSLSMLSASEAKWTDIFGESDSDLSGDRFYFEFSVPAKDDA